MALFPSALDLDLDVHAAARSSFISASTVCGRIDDVEKATMSPDLELLARFLIDVRRAIHREALDMLGRMGPRTRAPVRFAVLTISRVLPSSTR